MNILLFVTRQDPPAELTAELVHAGHLVNAVKTAQAALELIARDPPDICVLNADLAGDAFDAIVGHIVGADDLYRLLVVLVGKESPERRAALYSLGVDDVAGPTTTPHELASRITSAERIVRLERRLRERVNELEGALTRLQMNAVRRGQEVVANQGKQAPAEAGPFLVAASWTGVEELLGKMCAQYLGTPFQLVAGVAPPPSGSPGATVSLTDVDHELRIDVTFFAPVASAHAIAVAFAGGDASVVDDAFIRDVILELTNSGMGAVKSAFLGDGFRFVGSTPQPQLFAGAPSLLAGAEARRMLTFRSDTSFVHVFLAVRRTPRVRVKANMLREGMVVAVNVVNAAGVLMVPAGTRLTDVTAERIRRIMPKDEIELADPSVAA